jgi:hypothetical protein
MGFSDDNSPIYDRYKKPPKGAYAKNPLATPKYALQKGPRGNDFTDTQARIYLSSPLNNTSKLGNLEPLAHAVSDKNNGYVDFILQGVEQGLREKVDVIETLNDHYVAYFFGAAAEQWTFRGTFLNTKEDNQFIAFHEMYEKWLRGTKLADYRRIVALQYNGITVRGALTSLATSLNSEMETAMSFSFTLLVKDVHIADEHGEEFAVINGGTAAPGVTGTAVGVVAADIRAPNTPVPAVDTTKISTALNAARDRLAAASKKASAAVDALDAALARAVAAGLEGYSPERLTRDLEKIDSEDSEIRELLATANNLPEDDVERLNQRLQQISDQRGAIRPVVEAFAAMNASADEAADEKKTVDFLKSTLSAATAEQSSPSFSQAGDFTPQPVNVG